MKYISYYLIFGAFIAFGLSGCSADLTDPEISFEPPKYVEQMPAKQQRKEFSSPGSIFGQGDNPLFCDHKAMKVNDIVTIVINETAKSKTSGKRELSENDSLSLGGGAFANAGTNDKLNDYIGKINNYTGTTFKADSTSSFKGQGTATKDASFTTTVSARVIKVLENGNIFVHGTREILIDDQKQIIEVSGVIRPYDIDQFNRISSNQMSDAKILYKTQGDVDRATNQGWGSKVIHAIWPF